MLIPDEEQERSTFMTLFMYNARIGKSWLWGGYKDKERRKHGCKVYEEGVNNKLQSTS